MTSHLRPDELKTESEIERAKKRTGTVTEGLKAAAGLAAGGLGLTAASAGSKVASKILPFLNKYIPEDLAMKGINKISPQLGNFIKTGMKQGLSLSSGLEFLKENFMKQEEPKKEEAKPKEKQEKFGGAIRRYSEELMDFIEDYIARGRKPHEAGLMALQQKKFEPIIKKMEKDYKAPFDKILESLFGTMQRPEEMQQGQQSLANDVANPPHSVPPNHPLAAQHQQPQQAPQQGGQGQQALMSILQKIQQARGG